MELVSKFNPVNASCCRSVLTRTSQASFFRIFLLVVKFVSHIVNWCIWNVVDKSFVTTEKQKECRYVLTSLL